MQVGLHWSKIFTLRLTETVKLVGSTISCEPCWKGANLANERRQNAHVQSYVMATDQVRQLQQRIVHTFLLLTFDTKLQ